MAMTTSHLPVLRCLKPSAGRPSTDTAGSSVPGTSRDAGVHVGDRADAHVTPMLLLELPDDLLVRVLASRTSRARIWHTEQARPITKGHALAEAGACCHAFATSVQAAAKIVAGRQGWRLLPMAGGTPMQHLSKLEHDRKLVRACLRQVNEHTSSERVQALEKVNLWTQEVSLGFIGAISIDAQVRRQHTLELGRLLIEVPSRACPDDCLDEVCGFVALLAMLMTQPGTPLDASWLAARVFPLVDKLIKEIENLRNHKHTFKNSMRLVMLLCFLEPSVLRSHSMVNVPLPQGLTAHLLRLLAGSPGGSGQCALPIEGGGRKPGAPSTASGARASRILISHQMYCLWLPRSYPKIIAWLRQSLKSTYHRGDALWSAGLIAWKERCEAQGLGGCDKETRDAKLEAILHPRVRGCFVRLSALGKPVDQMWFSRIGIDFFPAVYH